jgi:hypothetical protein
VRDLLAREWQKTAVMTLVLAAVAGLRARLATPRWDKGDLIAALYLAVLSLLFWLRATQIRRGRGCAPSAARVIALVCGLAVGGLLLALDILTAGKV